MPIAALQVIDKPTFATHITVGFLVASCIQPYLASQGCARLPTNLRYEYIGSADPSLRDPSMPRVPVFQYVETSNPGPGQPSFRMVPATLAQPPIPMEVIERMERITQQLIYYLHRACPSERIVKLITEFSLDDNGQLWLVYCPDVRTEHNPLLALPDALASSGRQSPNQLQLPGAASAPRQFVTLADGTVRMVHKIGVPEVPPVGIKDLLDLRNSPHPHPSMQVVGSLLVQCVSGTNKLWAKAVNLLRGSGADEFLMRMRALERAPYLLDEQRLEDLRILVSSDLFIDPSGPSSLLKRIGLLGEKLGLWVLAITQASLEHFGCPGYADLQMLFRVYEEAKQAYQSKEYLIQIGSVVVQQSNGGIGALPSPTAAMAAPVGSGAAAVRAAAAAARGGDAMGEQRVDGGGGARPSTSHFGSAGKDGAGSGGGSGAKQMRGQAALIEKAKSFATNPLAMPVGNLHRMGHKGSGKAAVRRGSSTAANGAADAPDAGIGGVDSQVDPAIAVQLGRPPSARNRNGSTSGNPVAGMPTAAGNATAGIADFTKLRISSDIANANAATPAGAAGGIRKGGLGSVGSSAAGPLSVLSAAAGRIANVATTTSSPYPPSSNNSAVSPSTVIPFVTQSGVFKCADGVTSLPFAIIGSRDGLSYTRSSLVIAHDFFDCWEYTANVLAPLAAQGIHVLLFNLPGQKDTAWVDSASAAAEAAQKSNNSRPGTTSTTSGVAGAGAPSAVQPLAPARPGTSAAAISLIESFPESSDAHTGQGPSATAYTPMSDAIPTAELAAPLLPPKLALTSIISNSFEAANKLASDLGSASATGAAIRQSPDGILMQDSSLPGILNGPSLDDFGIPVLPGASNTSSGGASGSAPAATPTAAASSSSSPPDAESPSSPSRQGKSRGNIGSQLPPSNPAVLNNEFLSSAMQQLLLYLDGMRLFKTSFAPYPWDMIGIGNGGSAVLSWATRYSKQFIKRPDSEVYIPADKSGRKMASAPRGLRSIVTVNGWAHMDAQLQTILESTKTVFAAFPPERSDLPTAFFSRFLFSDRYLSVVPRESAVAQYARTSNPITLAGRLRIVQGALASTDVRNVLPAVPVPVVIIQSTDDTLVAPSNARAIASSRAAWIEVDADARIDPIVVDRPYIGPVSALDLRGAAGGDYSVVDGDDEIHIDGDASEYRSAQPPAAASKELRKQPSVFALAAQMAGLEERDLFGSANNSAANSRAPSRLDGMADHHRRGSESLRADDVGSGGGSAAEPRGAATSGNSDTIAVPVSKANAHGRSSPVAIPPAMLFFDTPLSSEAVLRLAQTVTSTDPVDAGTGSTTLVLRVKAGHELRQERPTTFRDILRVLMDTNAAAMIAAADFGYQQPDEFVGASPTAASDHNSPGAESGDRKQASAPRRPASISNSSSNALVGRGTGTGSGPYASYSTLKTTAATSRGYPLKGDAAGQDNYNTTNSNNNNNNSTNTNGVRKSQGAAASAALAEVRLDPAGGDDVDVDGGNNSRSRSRPTSRASHNYKTSRVSFAGKEQEDGDADDYGNTESKEGDANASSRRSISPSRIAAASAGVQLSSDIPPIDPELVKAALSFLPVTDKHIKTAEKLLGSYADAPDDDDAGGGNENGSTSDSEPAMTAAEVTALIAATNLDPTLARHMYWDASPDPPQSMDNSILYLWNPAPIPEETVESTAEAEKKRKENESFRRLASSDAEDRLLAQQEMRRKQYAEEDAAMIKRMHEATAARREGQEARTKELEAAAEERQRAFQKKQQEFWDQYKDTNDIIVLPTLPLGPLRNDSIEFATAILREAEKGGGTSTVDTVSAVSKEEYNAIADIPFAILRQQAAEAAAEAEKRRQAAERQLQLLAAGCAIRLQAWVRGSLARIHYRKMRMMKLMYSRQHAAVTKIQRLVRGRRGAMTAMRLRREQSLAWKYHHAATDFQRIVRGFLARLTVDAMRSDHASIKVQKVWRGYRDRMIVRLLRAAKQGLDYYNKSACAIQSAWKMFVTRRDYLELLIIRLAAVQVQRWYRGYKQRREYRRLRLLAAMPPGDAKIEAGFQHMRSVTDAFTRSRDVVEKLQRSLYRAENELATAKMRMKDAEEKLQTIDKKVAGMSAAESEIKSLILSKSSLNGSKYKPGSQFFSSSPTADGKPGSKRRNGGSSKDVSGLEASILAYEEQQKLKAQLSARAELLESKHSEQDDDGDGSGRKQRQPRNALSLFRANDKPSSPTNRKRSKATGLPGGSSSAASSSNPGGPPSRAQSPGKQQRKQKPAEQTPIDVVAPAHGRINGEELRRLAIGIGSQMPGGLLAIVRSQDLAYQMGGVLPGSANEAGESLNSQIERDLEQQKADVDFDVELALRSTYARRGKMHAELMSERDRTEKDLKSWTDNLEKLRLTVRDIQAALKRNGRGFVIIKDHIESLAGEQRKQVELAIPPPAPPQPSLADVIALNNRVRTIQAISDHHSAIASATAEHMSAVVRRALPEMVGGLAMVGTFKKMNYQAIVDTPTIQYVPTPARNQQQLALGDKPQASSSSSSSMAASFDDQLESALAAAATGGSQAASNTTSSESTKLVPVVTRLGESGANQLLGPLQPGGILGSGIITNTRVDYHVAIAGVIEEQQAQESFIRVGPREIELERMGITGVHGSDSRPHSAGSGINAGGTIRSMLGPRPGSGGGKKKTKHLSSRAARRLSVTHPGTATPGRRASQASQIGPLSPGASRRGSTMSPVRRDTTGAAFWKQQRSMMRASSNDSRKPPRLLSRVLQHGTSVEGIGDIQRRLGLPTLDPLPGSPAVAGSSVHGRTGAVAAVGGLGDGTRFVKLASVDLSHEPGTIGRLAREAAEEEEERRKAELIDPSVVPLGLSIAPIGRPVNRKTHKSAGVLSMLDSINLVSADAGIVPGARTTSFENAVDAEDGAAADGAEAEVVDDQAAHSGQSRRGSTMHAHANRPGSSSLYTTLRLRSRRESADRSGSPGRRSSVAGRRSSVAARRDSSASRAATSHTGVRGLAVAEVDPGTTLGLASPREHEALLSTADAASGGGVGGMAADDDAGSTLGAAEREWRDAIAEAKQAARHRFPRKLRDWSTKDVVTWLATLALSQYREAFESASVDGEFLLNLQPKDVRDVFGILDRVHLATFMHGREELRRADTRNDTNLAIGKDPEHLATIAKLAGGPAAHLLASLEDYRIPPWQAIFAACQAGKAGKVEQAIRAGFDPDTVDEYGNTMLILACRHGYKRIVDLLLSRGANINHKNHKGNTPLHFVCDPQLRLHIDPDGSFCNYLIHRGAQQNIRNKANYKAIDGLGGDHVALTEREGDRPGSRGGIGNNRPDGTAAGHVAGRHKRHFTAAVIATNTDLPREHDDDRPEADTGTDGGGNTDGGSDDHDRADARINLDIGDLPAYSASARSAAMGGLPTDYAKAGEVAVTGQAIKTRSLKGTGRRMSAIEAALSAVIPIARPSVGAAAAAGASSSRVPEAKKKPNLLQSRHRRHRDRGRSKSPDRSDAIAGTGTGRAAGASSTPGPTSGSSAFSFDESAAAASDQFVVSASRQGGRDSGDGGRAKVTSTPATGGTPSGGFDAIMSNKRRQKAAKVAFNSAATTSRSLESSYYNFVAATGGADVSAADAPFAARRRSMIGSPSASTPSVQPQSQRAVDDGSFAGTREHLVSIETDGYSGFSAEEYAEYYAAQGYDHDAAFKHALEHGYPRKGKGRIGAKENHLDPKLHAQPGEVSDDDDGDENANAGAAGARGRGTASGARASAAGNHGHGILSNSASNDGSEFRLGLPNLNQPATASSIRNITGSILGGGYGMFSQSDEAAGSFSLSNIKPIIT